MSIKTKVLGKAMNKMQNQYGQQFASDMIKFQEGVKKMVDNQNEMMGLVNNVIDNQNEQMLGLSSVYALLESLALKMGVEVPKPLIKMEVE